ncbi:hypothetical protein MLPF_2829 [Mycobacterium lepromatosis]|nr:hypothetical protein MLPF_2829 [Mycobacterium lepromatosis]
MGILRTIKEKFYHVHNWISAGPKTDCMISSAAVSLQRSATLSGALLFVHQSTESASILAQNGD